MYKISPYGWNIHISCTKLSFLNLTYVIIFLQPHPIMSFFFHPFFIICLRILELYASNFKLKKLAQHAPWHMVCHQDPPIVNRLNSYTLCCTTTPAKSCGKTCPAARHIHFKDNTTHLGPTVFFGCGYMECSYWWKPKVLREENTLEHVWHLYCKSRSCVRMWSKKESRSSKAKSQFFCIHLYTCGKQFITIPWYKNRKK